MKSNIFSVSTELFGKNEQLKFSLKQQQNEPNENLKYMIESSGNK